MQGEGFNSNSSPFEGNKTTAPINRVPYFKTNWLNITQDPTILAIVQGFQILFQRPPVQKTIPYPSLQNNKLVNEEIETLLHKGAMKHVHFSAQVFYHNVFSSQKRWWTMPSFGSKPSQQINSNGTFQNRKPFDNHISHKQRGLYDKYRSDRCILDHPNTPQLAKVSSLPITRKCLSQL